ncbi:MAG: amidohydrolase family protein, partial [Thermoplasmata archaeon]
SFKNCKVYSSFIPLKIHNSIIIDNGKVKSFEDDPDAIDLNGKFIIPAFIDSHLHLDEIGLFLNTLDLRGIRSINELREKLKIFAKNNNGPIIGHGWDQELFKERRWPNKYDIDDIVNDRPVILTRICLHAALVNSYFLDMMKTDGNGIVFENEFEIFRKRFIEMIPFELKMKYMENAIDFVAMNGISAVGFVSCNLESLKIIEKIQEKRKLPIDISIYLNAEDFLKYDFKNINVKGVKLFIDGSLGARTALLSEKYSDSNTYGEQVTDENFLNMIVERANEMKKDVAIHAIGDKALDIALNVLKNAKYGKRIEHASVVRDDQLEKLRGINIVVQPHFIISDFWVVDRLGVNRAKYVYRFKDLLNFTNLSFSTDSPVEPLNPFLTLSAAIERGGNKNLKIYEYTKDQTLKPEEAYYCYTEGSAKVLGLKYGSLSPGMEANFLVLDKDPLTTNPEKIKILGIYLKGKWILNPNL